MQKKHLFQSGSLVLAAMLLATVVGCGGGGGGGSASSPPVTPPPPPPPAQSRSGVLTDSQVAGVTYISSPSGKTGITDANGAYNFNAGDTVEFSLGNLILGSVTATGIVTPTELAAGNSNKLQNLLVVLQSLDADGNPANGITIPANSAAAVTTAINLTVAPASLNTAALQSAMTAGGITAPIVTTTDANAHYLSQGLTLLGSSIWVVRPTATNGNTTALFRFAANGEYLQGDAADADANSGPGVEHGTITLDSFDVHGYKIPIPTTTVDTNGQGGLSYSLLCDRWRSVGDRLIFTEDRTTPSTCENSTTDVAADKADNNPTGIVGVWAFESATVIKKLHIAFFSDGKYLMVDPWGDVPPVGGTSCGNPGVEAGSYTYNANQLTISNVTFNTNGCVGFFGVNDTTTKNISFVINADGTATLAGNAPGGGDIFYRVSK